MTGTASTRSSRATEPFDAIIVGSGATGGWAAKRLAEAGPPCRRARGRARPTEGDNREHVAASELQYRGRSKAPLARTRPRQSQSYACDEWNAHFFVNDLQEPYTDDTAVPVGRANAAGGRADQRVGPPELPLQRRRLQGRLARWRRRGLAARLSRTWRPTTTSSKRYVGISGAGGSAPPAARRCVPAADADDVRRAGVRDRVKARFDRSWSPSGARPTSRRRSTAARLPLLRPVRARVRHAFVFQLDIHHRPDALEDGQVHARHQRDGAPGADRSRHPAGQGIEYIDRPTREVHEVRARAVVVCAQMFESMRILFNSQTRQDARTGSGTPAGCWDGT